MIKKTCDNLRKVFLYTYFLINKNYIFVINLLQYIHCIVSGMYQQYITGKKIY